LHEYKLFPSREVLKEEISGSHPTDWAANLKTPRISLRTDDIEGARPDVSSSTGPTHSSITTNRVTNPLCPDYKLPSFSRVDPPVPRFIRDSITVADIDTTNPKKLFLTPRSSRLDSSDIEGTSSRSRTILLRGARSGADELAASGGAATSRSVGYDSLQAKVRSRLPAALLPPIPPPPQTPENKSARRRHPN
jgi:hypothetical protein